MFNGSVAVDYDMFWTLSISSIYQAKKHTPCNCCEAYCSVLLSTVSGSPQNPARWCFGEATALPSTEVRVNIRGGREMPLPSVLHTALRMSFGVTLDFPDAENLSQIT